MVLNRYSWEIEPTPALPPCATFPGESPIARRYQQVLDPSIFLLPFLQSLPILSEDLYETRLPNVSYLVQMARCQYGHSSKRLRARNWGREYTPSWKSPGCVR